MQISEEDLIAELQRLADELGRTPTQTEMNEHGEYSYYTYYNRFGSWNDALQEVGMKPNNYWNISKEELLDELNRLSNELDRMPQKKDMDEIGEYSPQVYYNKFDSWLSALQAIGCEWNNLHRISNDDLLEELQRLDNELERTPRWMDMRECGKFDATTYGDRFGSWNNALIEANISPNNAYDMSNKEILDDIINVGEELNRAPTYIEYDEMGRGSHKTVGSRFGSWNDALREAGFDPNHEMNISDSDLINEIHSVHEIVGDIPTIADMQRFGRWSVDPYRRSFGSWNEALEATGYEPYHVRVGDSERLYYGPNWVDIAASMRERDGHQCRICDDPTELYENALDVHHIMKLRKFDGYEEANERSNLVTLCRGCHREFEGYFIECDHNEFEQKAKAAKRAEETTQMGVAAD